MLIHSISLISMKTLFTLGFASIGNYLYSHTKIYNFLYFIFWKQHEPLKNP